MEVVTKPQVTPEFNFIDDIAADTDNLIEQDATTPKVGKIKAIEQIENKFPIEVFPLIFSNLIVETNFTLNYPTDYTGSALLSAISTTIGKTAKLHVKNHWEEYCSLYMVIVGNAGSVKSHPLEHCYSPLIQKDKESFAIYEPKKKYFDEYQALSAKEKKTAIEVGEPKLQKSIMGNFTPEILFQRIADNTRGVAVYSDEFETWLNGMNNYSKSDQSSIYLSFYSNKSTSIDRISTKHKPLYIEKPFLSIIGSTQERKLKELFAGKTDNGFLQRFLFALPDSSDKKEITENQMDNEVYTRFSNWISKYLIYSDGYTQGAKIYHWTPEAKKMYFDYQHRNTEKTNVAGDSLKGEVLNKFDIHYLRLALILQIMIDYTTDKISVEACIGAEKLCNYFEICAMRVLTQIEVESKINTKDVIKYLSDLGNSQNQIAEVLKITQPYVNRILKTA